MAKTQYRWSLANLFKSNVISSTNPAADIGRYMNKNVTNINASEFVDSTSLVNLNKIISEIRNPLAVYKDRYAEYKNMENEVIIQAALRSYADDATVFDNIKGVPLWVDSEDTNLGTELMNFLSNIEIDYKLWGWAYQIAQYGDLYVENIYNQHGYVIGIRPVSEPENIMHLIDHEDGSEGFLVRRDPRRTSSQPNALSEFDMYAMNKFTHFYLDDTPKVNSVIIQSLNAGGQIVPLELNLLRGRSILEPVRVNYRILRLLEDTIITNKIARAEYIRVFNVEVGDATGEGATRVISKLKRLFDAKPRFDGNTGEYNSQKVFRPAADALFNTINKGVGSIDIKEIGGNVETQFMVDVEYFRSKMFAGLQIPKTFLGFEESLPTNPGDATLAKLDIRYTRAVRRVQLALVRGIEDLLDAYLVSRHREYDAKRYSIRMSNPSSAEELARLDETLKRIEVIDSIVDSVDRYANGSVNLIQLYTELVNEYMESPRIKEIFEDLTGKAIAIAYLNINAQLNTARTESIASGRALYDDIIDLRAGGLMQEDTDPASDQLGGMGLGSGSDDDDSMSSRPSPGGFDDFGPANDFLNDPAEVDDDEFDDTGMSDMDLDQPEDIEDTEASDYVPGDRGVPLGSLSQDYDEDNPIESVGFKPQHGQTYRSSNSNKLQMIDDLDKLAIHGPRHMRPIAESLAYTLATSGFTDTNVAACLEYFRKVNDYYNKAGVSDTTYTRVTESLLSKDIKRKKALFSNLLKEDTDSE